MEELLQAKRRIGEELEFSRERLVVLESALKRGLRNELEKLGAYKLFQCTDTTSSLKKGRWRV
jgi:hypothetical protein